MPRSNARLLSANRRHFVRRAEILPALQRDRNVTVLPDEIVERAQIEFLALPHPRFGEEFRDLEFTDLVGDRLAGTYCERDRFLARCRSVHWDLLLQVLRGLFEREFAESELHID